MKKRKLVLTCLMAAMLLISAVACAPQTEPSPDAAAKTTGDVAAAPAKVSEEPVAETAWPERPVEIVVGAKPGGGLDSSARLVAKYLEKYLGKSFVIINTAGAGGSLASGQVLDSKSDGYTMLCANESLLANKVLGVTEFSYDAFAAAGVPLISYATGLVSKQFRAFDEMLAYAKENPGKLKFAVEAGTMDNQVAAVMERDLGITIQVVDAGNLANHIAMMAGDHVDFLKSPAGNVKDYIASNEFHFICFLTENRYDGYPDIPTAKECGVNYVLNKYFGFFFPKDVPAEILKKANDAFAQIAVDPDFIAEATALSLAVNAYTPAEAEEYLAKVEAGMVEYQSLLQ